MIAIKMSRLRIPIYFDYASTLCYIAWRIVTPLEDELGFEALWKGVPIAARDFRAKPGRVLGRISLRSEGVHWLWSVGSLRASLA